MPITLLTSAPPALTAEELAALSTSTPATFEGIAPLLRHREEQVTVTVEPAFQGFEGGKGTLWITEGAVSFLASDSSRGVSIPYPHITLHAISRAPLRSGSADNGGGGPCIYCQVDESDEAAEGAEDDYEDTSREVIIIPSDPSTLDKIFETLSTCAALHPPPSSASSGLFGGLDPSSMVTAADFADGSEIEQMTEEEEASMMTSAGRAAMAHLQSIISFPSSTTSSSAPQTNGATTNGAATSEEE
ncbi:hypothetical protein MNV49_005645 [Pseudohyphozyma bogoriensis]|nr:hypothetical protein MNV49_005645 [Pseudohyphozyma bogoriensis]